ncbi:hypothetical protein C8R44DRAFT_864143 [Mycena epipterygia]|nr:hypothetical protein C8R44DRAFT_864143 [Mycena epipterygia]
MARRRVLGSSHLCNYLFPSLPTTKKAPCIKISFLSVSATSLAASCALALPIDTSLISTAERDDAPGTLAYIGKGFTPRGGFLRLPVPSAGPKTDAAVSVRLQSRRVIPGSAPFAALHRPVHARRFLTLAAIPHGPNYRPQANPVASRSLSQDALPTHTSNRSCTCGNCKRAQYRPTCGECGIQPTTQQVDELRRSDEPGGRHYYTFPSFCTQCLQLYAAERKKNERQRQAEMDKMLKMVRGVARGGEEDRVPFDYAVDKVMRDFGNPLAAPREWWMGFLDASLHEELGMKQKRNGKRPFDLGIRQEYDCSKLRVDSMDFKLYFNHHYGIVEVSTQTEASTQPRPPENAYNLRLTSLNIDYPQMTSLDQVKAVSVWCKKDMRTTGRGTFNATTIAGDDPIFNLDPLPVSVHLGCPLVMRQTGTTSTNQADLDCQIATYLAIDPSSGFAPEEWQSRVGSVIVARRDKKPLSMQHLEGFWMYNDAILEAFQDGEIGDRDWFSQQSYEDWWADYCENAMKTRGAFQRMNGLTVTPGPRRPPLALELIYLRIQCLDLVNCALQILAISTFQPRIWVSSMMRRCCPFQLPGIVI